MSRFKVLTDACGSSLINVVGLGKYVPVDELDSALSKYEMLKQENAELVAMVESVEKKIKEEAYEAYWMASDENRCDRWSDAFDEDVRAKFEKYWQERIKAGE